MNNTLSLNIWIELFSYSLLFLALLFFESFFRHSRAWCPLLSRFWTLLTNNVLNTFTQEEMKILIEPTLWHKNTFYYLEIIDLMSYPYKILENLKIRQNSNFWDFSKIIRLSTAPIYVLSMCQRKTKSIEGSSLTRRRRT